MRMAMLEVLGFLIVDFVNSDELNDSQTQQLESYFDLLEERFRDTNSFVRSKLLQVLIRLCE
jgi:condensin complex subunit 1